MKLISLVNNIDMIKDINKYTDAYLIPIKDLSVNVSFSATIDELKIICKDINNKEIFILLNKNMDSSDLDNLEKTLKELNKLPIKGIFYYDKSIVMYKKDGLFNKELIWNQEHLVTNYDTCNFWSNNGVNGYCLSTDLTLDEWIEIRNNTKGILIAPLFGYQSMFVSKRNLVKNYLKTFNLNSDSIVHYIKKEGYTYPIINYNNRTEVYSHFILNGLEEAVILKEKGFEYALLSNFLIDNSDFIEVLKMFRNVNSNNSKNLSKKIDTMFNGNTGKGFFYKETVFKVK